MNRDAIPDIALKLSQVHETFNAGQVELPERTVDGCISAEQEEAVDNVPPEIDASSDQTENIQEEINMPLPKSIKSWRKKKHAATSTRAIADEGMLVAIGLKTAEEREADRENAKSKGNVPAERQQGKVSTSKARMGKRHAGCCVRPLPCFPFPNPPNCPPCQPSAVLTCKPRCCPPPCCPPYPCPPLLCPPCRPKPRCCPPKGCLPCTAPTCPSNQVCVKPPPCPRPSCTPLCMPVYAPRAPRVPCVDQRPRIVNVAVHEVRPSSALKFVYFNTAPGLDFCQQMRMEVPACTAAAAAVTVHKMSADLVSFD
ncbi:protein diaphanous homolog 1-like [Schistocerca piceifrons]|uniref:protein diaphanous homolog 1-like n=1 Tax=Schistocerca piceifrons TaxID=274613 RepID=UPI001F5E494B|nr:protein diaphanous homolog 1-like [Schistocerca piceifrons]